LVNRFGLFDGSYACLVESGQALRPRAPGAIPTRELGYTVTLLLERYGAMLAQRMVWGANAWLLTPIQ